MFGTGRDGGWSCPTSSPNASASSDELWLAEKEQRDGVTDDAPERDAEAQQPQGVEQRSLGATELLLSLCIGLPQLAWMGFLAYLAYNIVR